MAVRLYGLEPYQTAVVHGGPGAPGSVVGLARGISGKFAVLEPLQTKSSVDGLIEEFKGQLEQNCAGPTVLIGHSWGAWLAGLTAAAYPGLVSKLILIGCGPLDAKYVPEIGLRRERNMTRAEFLEYKALLSCLDKENTPERDKKLARLGAIAGKADGYDEIEDEEHAADAFPVDADAYASIWPEAAKMRESGQLLAEFLKIRCPIVLIQGNADSHPYIGVTEPLSKHGCEIKALILEKCGHTPWKERYASERFYRVLFEEIETDIRRTALSPIQKPPEGYARPV